MLNIVHIVNTKVMTVNAQLGMQLTKLSTLDLNLIRVYLSPEQKV
jgi:hypothetical protein